MPAKQTGLTQRLPGWAGEKGFTGRQHLVQFGELKGADVPIQRRWIIRPAAGGQCLHPEQGEGEYQQIGRHIAALMFSHSVYSCRD